nr:MAG TPA: KTSC domain [Caudoviricetes sp.]
MKKRMLPTAADQPKDFLHLMNMYGLQYDGHHDGYSNSYKNSMTHGESTIHVYECNGNTYDIVVTDTTPEGLVSSRTLTVSEVYDLISYLDLLMTRYENEIMSTCCMYDISGRDQVILAAISTRDLSKNLVRVKSSNIWAYTINVKDRKAKTGDVLCQFKGKNGGPGDIYMYFDVPVSLWRKWLAATSKGSFFWRYIRNNFWYRKLTGDKKGKLKNAIN